MKTIAILGGTGQQGGGLARRLARAGARVVVGSRDPDRARRAIAEWSAISQPIEVAGYSDAVEQADVALLAVPFGSIDPMLDELRSSLKSGSLVIDVTVPIAFVAGKMTMLDVAEGSATEHIRARLAGEVGLAATFKTIPAHLLAAGDESLDCDEFVCGDSDEARAGAIELVKMLPGLRPVDVGPLSRARSIEQLTALAIGINRRHKIHDARFRIVGL